MEMGPRQTSPARPEARLGKLVQLPKRGRTRTRAQSAGTGEVLLFTGVRYERGGGSSPMPDKPVGTASGGKRRRG